jgi:hypothetical protein
MAQGDGRWIRAVAFQRSDVHSGKVNQELYASLYVVAPSMVSAPVNTSDAVLLCDDDAVGVCTNVLSVKLLQEMPEKNCPEKILQELKRVHAGSFKNQEYGSDKREAQIL